MVGLPFDASVWEQQTLALERSEAWHRAMLDALLKKKSIRVPGELVFGGREAESASPRERTTATSAADVAAWFGEHFQGPRVRAGDAA